MHNSSWKKIIIALMVFAGIMIVLGIVPGFVALVTTPNIINVNTESQWISFWGYYLGAITGGALSGGFAIYVMLNTIKNSRADQRRHDVLEFMKYLSEKSSEIFTNTEDLLYIAHECIAKRSGGDINIEKENQFLKSAHSIRNLCYTLHIQMGARKTETELKKEDYEKLYTEYSELFALLSEYEKMVLSVRKLADIGEIDKKIADLINEMANQMPVVIEEISKITN